MPTDPSYETKGPRFQVLFGSRDAVDYQPNNSLLITPHRSGNPETLSKSERGIRVDFHIRIGRNENHRVQISAFIGFLGLENNARNGADYLGSLVRAQGVQMLSATEHQFFTMLPSMQEYRDLLRFLGVENAKTVSLEARDLVALNELKRSTKWLIEAERSNVFQTHFIHTTEAFFAYKNAGPLLRGLSEEQLDRMSKRFAIRFHLDGCVGDHDFDFRFDHEATIPKRIAVVIGKNGVGKSQTLGRIARAAMSGSRDLTDGDMQRPVFNRLLAFAPTNEAESVFPTPKKEGQRVWYRRYSLNRSRRKHKDYIADLILQLVRGSQTIAEQSRFSIFQNALRTLAGHEQLALQTDRRFVPISQLLTGTEDERLELYRSIQVHKELVRVVNGSGYPLSSGEISFARFAAQVSLHIENGSLLLLDEPETHLHPNFISQFVALLSDLLKQTGSAAIISTHSVYFVREVFRDQVTIVSVDAGRNVKIQQPMLRTFGADVGAISFFVFDQDEPSQLASEVRSRLLSGGKSWDDLFEQYSGEFSLEFLGDLKSAMRGEQ